MVFTIDTLTTSDQPDSRGRQLLSSLDYLTQQSSVRSRIDSSRLGVVGHSMGGGGTLEAARSRPSLQAAIPLTGWNLTKSWSTVRVPTLVVGAQADTVAPVASHSIPFYTSLPSSLDKAYLELRGASHFAPNSANTTIAKYTLSWLKRFIDDDTRYEQFLCPIPGTSTTISDYRGNCPHMRLTGPPGPRFTAARARWPTATGTATRIPSRTRARRCRPPAAGPGASPPRTAGRPR